MWWRLIGEIDSITRADNLVRVVGRKRGAAAIEIDYLGPAANLCTVPDTSPNVHTAAIQCR
ncbi:hypothetical protein, partial [Escherichia coli]|uniref:hypothetical protein n=1 Tax=Escherichia coli TaxID=562 RepID=UPI003D35C4C1